MQNIPKNILSPDDNNELNRLLAARATRHLAARRLQRELARDRAARKERNNKFIRKQRGESFQNHTQSDEDDDCFENGLRVHEILEMDSYDELSSCLQETEIRANDHGEDAFTTLGSELTSIDESGLNMDLERKQNLEKNIIIIENNNNINDDNTSLQNTPSSTLTNEEDSHQTSKSGWRSRLQNIIQRAPHPSDSFLRSYHNMNSLRTESENDEIKSHDHSISSVDSSSSSDTSTSSSSLRRLPSQTDDISRIDTFEILSKSVLLPESSIIQSSYHHSHPITTSSDPNGFDLVDSNNDINTRLSKSATIPRPPRQLLEEELQLGGLGISLSHSQSFQSISSASDDGTNDSISSSPCTTTKHNNSNIQNNLNNGRIITKESPLFKISPQHIQFLEDTDDDDDVDPAGMNSKLNKEQMFWGSSPSSSPSPSPSFVSNNNDDKLKNERRKRLSTLRVSDSSATELSSSSSSSLFSLSSSPVSSSSLAHSQSTNNSLTQPIHKTNSHIIDGDHSNDGSGRGRRDVAADAQRVVMPSVSSQFRNHHKDQLTTLHTTTPSPSLSTSNSTSNILPASRSLNTSSITTNKQNEVPGETPSSPLTGVTGKGEGNSNSGGWRQRMQRIAKETTSLSGGVELSPGDAGNGNSNSGGWRQRMQRILRERNGPQDEIITTAQE